MWVLLGISAWLFMFFVLGVQNGGGYFNVEGITNGIIYALLGALIGFLIYRFIVIF